VRGFPRKCAAAPITQTPVWRDPLILRILSVVLAVVLSTISTCPVQAAEKVASDRWTPLFNGRNLDGWSKVLTTNVKDFDPESVFKVHDGQIHVYQDIKNGEPVPVGFIRTDAKYSWYHLRVDYRWAGKRFAPRTEIKRDAGVLYHVGDQERVWPCSIECQIQEGDTGDCFTVMGTRVHTTVDPVALKSNGYRYLAADQGGVPAVQGGPRITRVVKGSTHENDGWNTVEVICHGSEQVTHIVNGHVVFRATDLQQLDTDEHSWIPLKSGRILLQSEFAEVLYRNVEIKSIEGKPFRIE
jgi:hypothetical protein